MSKKKQIKKKQTKNTKLSKKRKPRIKYKTIDSTDNFVKILNKVQINKKSVILLIDNKELLPILLNLIKDADLNFKLEDYYTKTKLVILPNDIEYGSQINIDDIDKNSELEIEIDWDFFNNLNI